jgi:hypothetical protein
MGTSLTGDVICCISEDVFEGLPHAHQDLHLNKTGPGLTPSQKDIIRTCIHRHQQQPKKILAEFDRLKTLDVTSGKSPVCAPLTNQISSFLSYERRKSRGHEVGATSLQNIEQFAITNGPNSVNERVIPGALEKEDIAYVASFKYDDSNYDEPKAWITLTTERLMALNSKSELSEIKLHCDSTYKLLYENLPLHVIGQDDRNRHHHVQMICVSMNEKEEDYNHLLNSWDSERHRVLQVDTNTLRQPVYFLADGAEASANAASALWTPIKRLMCFAHVYRNCQEKVKFVHKHEWEVELLHDIKMISIAWTDLCFQRLLILFRQKWMSDVYATSNNGVKNFIEYFFKQWTSSRIHNWFRGAALNHTLNNNGMEACNKVIKDDITQHHLLPLMDFYREVWNILQLYLSHT